jgi:ribonuclease Z
LKLAKSWTDYELHFKELESTVSVPLYEDEHVKVATIPLDHRVYTNGFLFSTKSEKRKIKSKAIAGLDLKPFHFLQLQDGFSIQLENGNTYKNEELTAAPDPPKQYAYCSDTAYNKALIDRVAGVDLLYHESTFLELHKELAKKTKHSTAKEAADIAQKAGVKKLMLGHYSNRYSDKNDFIKEASVIFENVILSEDLKSFSI